MKKKIILTYIIFIAFATASAKESDSGNDELTGEKHTTIHFPYLPVRDTIYVLGDRYIEVDLKNQTAILYRRDDTSSVFLISSGNEYITDGMKTPEGIYTVQSKYKTAVSRQFDNAKLTNWIGFNGNIGFHGLETDDYYRHLGKRPSSHGCLRIGRESGKRLYEDISVGTPVMVYNDNPARVFAFIKRTEIHPNSDIFLVPHTLEQMRMLNRRLDNLYAGRAFIDNAEKVILDGETVLKYGGYDIGCTEKIPAKQKRPFAGIRHNSLPADNLRNFSGFVFEMPSE